MPRERASTAGASAPSRPRRANDAHGAGSGQDDERLIRLRSRARRGTPGTRTCARRRRRSPPPGPASATPAARCRCPGASRRGRARRRACAGDSGVVPGSAPSRLRRYASWRKSQPWRWADAAQEAQGQVASLGGGVARDAAELEARLAGAHVALDHLRQDVPMQRGAGGARKRAVLDDRDRSRRAAEHETVLGDASELPPDPRRARRERRSLPSCGAVVATVVAPADPAAVVVGAPVVRAAAAASGRHDHDGCQQRRSPTTRPHEAPLRRPLAVPFRLHESRQGSRRCRGRTLAAWGAPGGQSKRLVEARHAQASRQLQAPRRPDADG